MRIPSGLSPESIDALKHLKGRREVNTVILRCAQTPSPLPLELKGNLTHDELLEALPPDAARLVVHELAFATREGARRHETLLILWTPSGSGEQEESCSVAYRTLKEFLTDVRIQLTASSPDQLDYQRLVALVG
ncbi:hypothetical protein ACFWC9_38355 [Streptomyces goshikiensis]|uniref:hypothetical protein n=1 Tax=Streptomyces goshikiensis TaxID=1942 RepID=UPI0036AEA5F9